MLKKNELAMLCFFLLLCLIVGLIGSHWTQESVHTWYLTLRKPSWTPPPFIFPIAWTILYILMGVSAWLIWKTEAPASLKRVAYGAFGVQLFLNFIWSYLFFSLKSPLLGFFDIILLVTAISFTIACFYRIRPLSAYLLIPYLLWVFFALCLNGAILTMN